MAYIVSTPVTSTSHALGMNRSLIMLISVHTLQPKFCCTDVQHWIAVASSALASIHRDSTTPSLAICVSFSSGTSGRRCVAAYLVELGLARPRSSSLSLPAWPRISERSTVVTLMPCRSRIFSL